MLGDAYRRAHEAFNLRLRSFGDGRWASRCRPAVVLFLLTELCNAKCVHCDIWKNRGKEDNPSPDQYKAALSDLRSWLGPIQVVFTGGEALLKPYTIDLVAHASAIGLYLEILTHGYWDDQSKIEKLVLAHPRRVTVSLDGVGDTHTKVRGREKFFEKSSQTIQTIQRVRREKRLNTVIRLKTVIMSHNLDDVCNVAKYARQDGMEAFFQPIEQNYNTPEDSHWFEHSENWPQDGEKAVKVVEQLIRMKREGFPIANSYEQLEVMVPYFRDPDAHRIATQSHVAHEHRILCAALTEMQIQANGDVTTCYSQPPAGNIKTAKIKDIWLNRPRWWETGCCLERRCSDEEKRTAALVTLE